MVTLLVSCAGADGAGGAWLLEEGIQRLRSPRINDAVVRGATLYLSGRAPDILLEEGLPVGGRDLRSKIQRDQQKLQPSRLFLSCSNISCYPSNT